MSAEMAKFTNPADVISPPPYKLMLSCPSGLSPSQVSVIFDQAYDRIPHPDSNLENSIAQYGGHAFHTGDVGHEQDCQASLHLGLTDYRTFVGTNLNPLWEKFLIQSEDETVRCQHTSNPLGNGGIVESSDGKILVLKRSNNVGEFPGYFVFPGGHPELEEVGIMCYENLDLEALKKRVSLEMFDSIVREVVEE
ncbi:Nudix hydrolase 9, partial [Bienertia sinuspersici]